MRLKHPAITNLAGWLAAGGISRWMSTLDYRIVYHDSAVDPVKPTWDGQKIYVFWHEYMLFPLYLRGHCNLAMLLSRHRDADLLTHVARRLGFEFVRGSTTRGGASALRELLDRSGRMNLTITPDGPRGPRRRLAPGPIYLAAKSGLPIVAMGFAYRRPWRLGSWDKFAIPKPYSQARACISPELRIPPDLNRAGLEHYRQVVENWLTHLSAKAEDWAESGCRQAGEMPLRKAKRNRSGAWEDAAIIGKPMLGEFMAAESAQRKQMPDQRSVHMTKAA